MGHRHDPVSYTYEWVKGDTHTQLCISDMNDYVLNLWFVLQINTVRNLPHTAACSWEILSLSTEQEDSYCCATQRLVCGAV